MDGFINWNELFEIEQVDLSSLDDNQRFYHPLCTLDEIARVFAPKDARDYLLGLRAHYIVDQMRIYRFFLRLRRDQKAAYSLQKNFDIAHYRDYLSKLGTTDQELLAPVTFGDVFTREANGEIFNSPFGRIVTISRTMKYFLEYGNLALLKFHCEVPLNVRFSAAVIALRVMFQYEALDFEVDPRGKISERLKSEMLGPLPGQFSFIVGHEFAHHLLGHLSDDNTHESLLLAPSEKATLAPALVYSVSQQQEFDADLASIMRPQITDEDRADLLQAALLWFGILDLYQHARDVVAPMPPWKPRTHPSARDRCHNLLKGVETRYSREIQGFTEDMFNLCDGLKGALTAYLTTEIDQFEVYGSVYLGAPESEWRGRELKDREDYY